MAIIDIDDIIGHSFKITSGNQTDQITVVDVIRGHNDKRDNNPDLIKFKVRHNESDIEELMAYNDLMEHINENLNSPTTPQINKIIAHQGPLDRDHPDYKGSQYNVTVVLGNEEQSDMTLLEMATEDPVSCANYAKKHNLLNTPG